MDFVVERLVTLPEELVNLPFYPVDPRVQGWFGLDWAFVLGVTTAYLVGVGILMGIMKTQSSPFSLYAYRIAHNFVMCAVSFYMFAEIMRLGLTQGFFKELDRTTDSLPMAHVIWVFYISKVFEFNDTLIMILRQKYSQVTVLHVYHHWSVTLMWFLNCRIYPGTFAATAAAFNSFIHVLMYLYYGVSTYMQGADGAGSRWNPWWKKYLTQLQLIQFTYMIGLGIWLTFYGDPRYRVLGSFNGLYAVTLYALFWNFYSKSYTKKKPKSS